MVPSIKGNQVILAKKYFTQRFGVEAVKNVIAGMSEVNRPVLEKTLMSGAWESEEAYGEFIGRADALLGSGNYEAARACGYYMAKEGAPITYKIFFRVGDPAFVIERAGRFWHQVHNNGELTITKTGKTSVIGRLTGKAFPSKAFCASLAGYFHGILELCGAKDIRVQETQCCATGAKTCEFDTSWK